MTTDADIRHDSPAPSAATAQWLDRDEQLAWRTFLHAVFTLTERISDALEQDPEIDLSLAEYEILVRLSESETGRLRMSELADHLVHSRSRLSHTVARLEKRGLVDRERCQADGRGREAVLTPAGLALLRAAAPRHVASVRAELLDVVGREDFLTLGRILRSTLPEELDVMPPENPAADRRG
ncbi:MarR family transcriptional regulator [Brachybacterium sp. EF45031]|uniref:MarR family winged helix-turn-helix transcriptional regulator n=1 Tax=Brachybacterium sillae TaxID=2810536 RepID=UPI00217F2047|nr:MarR family transcriptional regulator [Brachybacterium sillae]MCS6711314.1 MarR family transcriptional regulator [Brachybacterium sillae]